MVFGVCRSLAGVGRKGMGGGERSSQDHLQVCQRCDDGF